MEAAALADGATHLVDSRGERLREGFAGEDLKRAIEGGSRLQQPGQLPGESGQFLAGNAAGGQAHE